jgi:hypothetical protein
LLREPVRVPGRAADRAADLAAWAQHPVPHTGRVVTQTQGLKQGCNLKRKQGLWLVQVSQIVVAAVGLGAEQIVVRTFAAGAAERVRRMNLPVEQQSLHTRQGRELRMQLVLELRMHLVLELRMQLAVELRMQLAVELRMHLAVELRTRLGWELRTRLGWELRKVRRGQHRVLRRQQVHPTDQPLVQQKSTVAELWRRKNRQC